MRLIDADKIRFKDLSDGQVPNGIWYCLLDDIREQPTVKAIPVEYIQKSIKSLKYRMAYSTDKIARGYQDQVNILEWLIYSWELQWKEGERK